MTLSSRFRSRSTFRRGQESWRRGHLDEAERLLRETAQLRPRSGGALLYLARVLSERGDLPGALGALDDARSAGAHSEVVDVFTLLVRYDHEGSALDLGGSRAPKTPNVLSRSLETLVDLRKRVLDGPESPEATALEARLPLAARWIAEITGRVLALLDRALLLRDRDGWVRLHHDLIAELFFDVAPGDTPDLGPARGWREEVIEAFIQRDYARVDGLFQGGKVPPGRPPSMSLVCRAFSLLALDKPAKALALARTVDDDPEYSTDARLLEGLGHSLVGRIAEAGWSFTRAARCRDIEVDSILQRVSAALPLVWVWEE